MVTVAQNIVDTLVANGIERVYGLPGDSLNGFTDAIRTSGALDWLHVRHEEARRLRRRSGGGDDRASSPSAPAAAARATCT